MTDTDRLLVWLRATLDAAERIARATTPVPVAGEWAAVRDKYADEDAPLSLIQGQDPHEPDYKGYSSGVPIIATALEETRPFARHVYLAQDATGFIAAAERAVAEGCDPARRAARRALADEHTCERRAAQFDALLAQVAHER